MVHKISQTLIKTILNSLQQKSLKFLQKSIQNIISHRKSISCRGCSYFCPISYSIIPNVLSFYPKFREIQLILFYLKLPFRALPNFRLINPKFRHLGDLYLQCLVGTTCSVTALCMSVHSVSLKYLLHVHCIN